MESSAASFLHRSILALILPGQADGVDLHLEPAERAFLIEVTGEFPSGNADRGFVQRVDRYKSLLPGIREVLGDGKVRCYWRPKSRAGPAQRGRDVLPACCFATHTSQL